jgi:hypothetical protein
MPGSDARSSEDVRAYSEGVEMNQPKQENVKTPPPTIAVNEAPSYTDQVVGVASDIKRIAGGSY